MAKGLFVGVNGAPRKAKMYIGVNQVAKKIKKGYVGANGTAKLFFDEVGDADDPAEEEEDDDII